MTEEARERARERERKRREKRRHRGTGSLRDDGRVHN
jgi:hypothetical protein